MNSTVGDMPAADPVVRDQLLQQQSTREDRRDAIVAAVRQVVVFGAFLGLCALSYTGYKAFGTAIDDAQHEWWAVGSVLPKTDDLTMPPLADILGAFNDPVGASNQTYGSVLFDKSMFTLREAAVGFAIGLVIGLAIAIVLARWKRLEDGFLPFVIASQTVPLVAIAPIVVIWGEKNFDFLPWEWQKWMSVSLIATYLTFFPVAVNGLRGLQSPRSEHLELMDSYAAGWGQRLWRLQLPASLPYLFAAFKIAASASIVGAIVGEISAGVEGGIGRRILGDALAYTTAPSHLYASVIAAAVLGIAVFLVISGIERLLLSRQGREALA